MKISSQSLDFLTFQIQKIGDWRVEICVFSETQFCTHFLHSLRLTPCSLSKALSLRQYYHHSCHPKRSEGSYSQCLPKRFFAALRMTYHIDLQFG